MLYAAEQQLQEHILHDLSLWYSMEYSINIQVRIMIYEGSHIIFGLKRPQISLASSILETSGTTDCRLIYMVMVLTLILCSTEGISNFHLWRVSQLDVWNSSQTLYHCSEAWPVSPLRGRKQKVLWVETCSQDDSSGTWGWLTFWYLRDPFPNLSH